MKKHLMTLLASCAVLLAPIGCESFLDKSPDVGLSEEDVYRDYASMRSFLDAAYDHLDQWYRFSSCSNGRTHIGAISDEFASLYNSSEAIKVNSGNWLSPNITTFEIGNDDGSSNTGTSGSTSIYKAYRGIRIANRVIRDIDRGAGLSPAERDGLLGQAYFLRAWFYFQLIIRYGGMPVFDKLFSGDGSEDIPRVSYHESHAWMVSDIERAVELLPDAWDDANVGRPNRIAALAFRSEADLYDASPLMQNPLTSTTVQEYDKQRALLAARSAQAVIDYIASHTDLGYELIPTEEYAHIFYWTTPPYTQREYLWYNRTQSTPGATYNASEAFTRYMRCFWMPGQYAQGTGNDAVSYNAPTQNMVNLFEKRGTDGAFYPIGDVNAGYDPQHPFEARDPRLKNNILVPGEKWGKNLSGADQYITTYVGGDLYNEPFNSQYTNKRQLTGYLCKKYWWPEANQWSQGYALYRTITVYIRLAEIYLNYAEAAFEATGSATAVPDGCSLTALAALNVVRNRAGIGDLPLSLQSATAFRDAYRRERAVELMFENKRWWDLRRWMIAHEVFSGQYPIKGLRATPKLSSHASIADKSTLEFTYETVDVIPEQRVFVMRNYWYPFPMNDVASLNHLKQNPLW